MRVEVEGVGHRAYIVGPLCLGCECGGWLCRHRHAHHLRSVPLCGGRIAKADQNTLSQAQR